MVVDIVVMRLFTTDGMDGPQAAMDDGFDRWKEEVDGWVGLGWDIRRSGVKH